MPREDEPNDRPPPRARRRDDDDRDDRDDDRPRRRRYRDDDEDEYEARRARTDATGGLIPYKNGKALAAYYCGVFALIPCFGGILAILALIFGFLGLSYAKKHPEARGKGHAIAGIVLGVICTLAWIVGPIVFVIVNAIVK
jgi:hypothetical protein